MRVISAIALVAVVAAPAALADDGTRPGDEAMTCEQIATELMPYAQQMRGTATAAGADAQEYQRRMIARQPEMEAEAAADSAATSAGCIAGVNAACAAASEAVAARQRARNAQIAAEDKPLTDRMSADTQSLMAQAQAMQNNPRVMRLMQLAQEKNCP